MSAFKGWQNTNNNPLFAKFPNIQVSSSNDLLGFPNALFDLDASYGLSSFGNGDSLSFWKDQILGIEFTSPAGANNPIYTLADANFNNYPSVNFNTAAKILIAAYGIGLPANFTLIIAYKINTINSTVNCLFGPNVNTGIGRFIAGGLAAYATGFGYYNDTAALLNSGVEDTAPHIAVITNTEIVVDGVSTVTGSIIPLSAPQAIGATVANSGQNAFAAISKISIFPYAMNSQEMIALCNNLNSLYLIY